MGPESRENLSSAFQQQRQQDWREWHLDYGQCSVLRLGSGGGIRGPLRVSGSEGPTLMRRCVQRQPLHL